MIYRRLVALCTGLSLLHLTLVGGDLACASHGRVPAGKSSQVQAGMLMPHANDTADQDHATPDKAPCDAPTRPDCCQAMSCSMTVLISTAAVSPERVESHERVVATLIAAPSSLTIAPEPPPPKA